MENTGPQMWKILVGSARKEAPNGSSLHHYHYHYWSSDMEVLVPGYVKSGPEMLSEESGNVLRKMKYPG